jgi:hypothetical protein
MSWWDGDRVAYRDELRRAALELAEIGWPVLPGTYRQADQWAGMPDAPQSCSVPVLADGPAAASRDPRVVEAWWADLPHSVLVVTGSVVDVIEVSALIGRRLHTLLQETGIGAPVGVTPAGRWWFGVRAGEALRPELAARPEVALHGRGSWVAAPPSECGLGSVHWRVSPASVGGTLPDTYDVQLVLLEVLGQRRALATTVSSGAVATGVHS